MCRPESACLGVLWKRLPFHTGVNEGAGHMGRGGGGGKEGGDIRWKDEEGENGMRWRGAVGGDGKGQRGVVM